MCRTGIAWQASAGDREAELIAFRVDHDLPAPAPLIMRGQLSASEAHDLPGSMFEVPDAELPHAALDVEAKERVPERRKAFGIVAIEDDFDDSSIRGWGRRLRAHVQITRFGSYSQLMKRPRRAMANAMMARRSINRVARRMGGGHASNGLDRSSQRVQIAAGRTGADRRMTRTTGLG